jgi:hypothetical protein
MGGQGGADLYLMFNADTAAIPFVLPASPGRMWRLAADTSHAPPGDVCDPGEETVVNATSYIVEPRSSVVLIAR